MEKPKQSFSFDVSTYLSQDGLRLIDKQEDSDLMVVEDQDQNKFELSLSDIKRIEGLEDTDIVPEYNSPETAINRSTVSLLDRALLQTGDDNKINYLKKKYEDAVLTEDGLVYKEAGAWHKVDPAWLGDGSAWQQTKEFAKDIADWGTTVVNSSAFASGFAVGGIPGALAASAAEKGAEIIMGRHIGTYGGNNEALAKDIAWNAVFDLVGLGIGKGVETVAKGAKTAAKDLDMLRDGVFKAGEKPTSSQLARTIVGGYQRMSEGTADLLSTVVGDMSGAGQGAVKKALRDPDIMLRAAKATDAVGDSSIAAINLKDKAMSSLTDNLDEFTEAPGKMYREGIESIQAKWTGKTLPTSVQDEVLPIFKAFEESGFGQISIGKGGQFSFIPLSDMQVQAFREAGKMPNHLAYPQAKQVFESVLKSFYSKNKDAKSIINTFISFNQEGNKLLKQAYKSGDMAAEGVANQLLSAVRTQTDNLFSRLGIADDWMKAKEPYLLAGDLVNKVNKVIKDPAKSEKFLDSLLRDSVTPQGKNSTLNIMKSIMPSTWYNRLDDGLKNLAASKVATVIPETASGRYRLGGGVAATLGGSSMIPIPGIGALGIGAAVASSPKVGTKTLIAGRKVLSLIRGLSDKAREELLQDPTRLQAIFKTLGDARQIEAQTEEEAVKSAVGQK